MCIFFIGKILKNGELVLLSLIVFVESLSLLYFSQKKRKNFSSEDMTKLVLGNK